MKLRNECPSKMSACSPEHKDAMVEWCQWRCHNTCGIMSMWTRRARKWEVGFFDPNGVWILPDMEHADCIRGEVDYYRESLQDLREDLRKWKAYRETGDAKSLSPK